MVGVLALLVVVAIGVLFFLGMRAIDDMDFPDEAFSEEFPGDVFSEDVVDPFGDADSYGDDPELDALWDACDGGDMGACDDLFFQSPFGSEYEDFGQSCGGTRPGETDLCDQAT